MLHYLVFKVQFLEYVLFFAELPLFFLGSPGKAVGFFGEKEEQGGGLQIRDQRICFLADFVLTWWRWGESNSWPPACKAGALPAELHPHLVSLS